MQNHYSIDHLLISFGTQKDLNGLSNIWRMEIAKKETTLSSLSSGGHLHVVLHSECFMA